MTLAAACGFAPAQDQPPAPAQPTPPGQQQQPSQPDTRPSYPALERLNAECVSLHERLQAGVARVQVPAGPLARAPDNARDGPWNRYKISPEVRQELQRRAVEQQSLRLNAPGANAGQVANASPAANAGQAVDGGGGGNPTSAPPGTPTAPAGAGATADARSGKQPLAPPPQNGVTIVVPPQPSYANNADPQVQSAAQAAPPSAPAQASSASPLVLDNYAGQRFVGGTAAAAGGFAPNAIGLLLNDRGHVLVPFYLDRDALGDQPVRLAWGGDDAVLDARLVGADQQTQLSVLKLAALPAPIPSPAAAAAADGAAANTTAPATRPAGVGRPLALADRNPPDGALVLVLNPFDGAGRLTVWNGAAPAGGREPVGGGRESGVVVTIDGQIAGVARAGQFLSGKACRLIADQIVRHGAVRRATLGVLITQVDPADPARRRWPAELGDRPAVRVDQVVKGSAADRGGLRAGDLILTLAGDPVHDIPGLAAAVAARSGPTDLTVLRDGRVTPATVDLVQR